MTNVFPLIRRVRRCGREDYLAYVTLMLLLLAAAPLDHMYAMPVQVVGICATLLVTTGRLFDAGLSRFWACLILPTLGEVK